MSPLEKLFSLLAIAVITGLACALAFYPPLREWSTLLPLSLIGLCFNAGLLFVVFKDIFSRSFTSSAAKIFWVVLIFFFMPSILVYLPLHGFRKR